MAVRCFSQTTSIYSDAIFLQRKGWKMSVLTLADFISHMFLSTRVGPLKCGIYTSRTTHKEVICVWSRVVVYWALLLCFQVSKITNNSVSFIGTSRRIIIQRCWQPVKSVLIHLTALGFTWRCLYKLQLLVRLQIFRFRICSLCYLNLFVSLHNSLINSKSKNVTFSFYKIFWHFKVKSSF